MRVLGVDPGTRATGYGVLDRRDGSHALVECGVIRTDSAHELPLRLLRIHEGLLELIDRHAPDCLAVEGVFTGRNARTAMVLGHARGVVLLAGATRGLPVAEYPPADVKKAIVGTGGATKRQVAFMVQQHLRLREEPRPADAADGCAVALCHLFQAALDLHAAAGGRP